MRKLNQRANTRKRDYDAELREWAFETRGQLTVAYGRVYGDHKRRWPDGYAIMTSAILSGSRKEGDLIRTRNTRYLLSGPPGDLGAMLALATTQSANAERRNSAAAEEGLFDLLQAAWGMDDATFEKVAGLPPKWMWEWRNHYRAPSDQELVRIRRLMRFHDAIRLVTYGEPDYSAWWRRVWRENSGIGNRSPLDAVLANGDATLDYLEQCFRSQAGW